MFYIHNSKFIEIKKQNNSLRIKDATNKGKLLVPLKRYNYINTFVCSAKGNL